MLSNLVDLAREGSSEKRRELLGEISNLFADGAEAHNDRETLLFGEVLTKLLDQVPIDDRVIVSNRVASLEQTPRQLALKLANDEAIVAAPVLQHSPVLTDEDLVALASNQSQEHLVAISQRARLSEIITDVLIDRGNSQVLNTVTRNLGASFSEGGFEALVEKAKADRGLTDALSYRPDIPTKVADKILAILSPVARQRLEFLLAQGREKLDEVFDEARKQMDSSKVDNRRARLETKVFVADIREGRRKLDDVIDELCLKKRLLDIAFVLSEVASVPEPHVNNVLHKVNAMGIAVVCRSVDIGETTYDRLMRLRCERLKLNTAQVAPMVREYMAIDRPSAERALRFHKVRTAVVKSA
jgi:uncharacterized protein (DUF2336 family)